MPRQAVHHVEGGSSDGLWAVGVGLDEAAVGEACFGV